MPLLLRIVLPRLLNCYFEFLQMNKRQNRSEFRRQIFCLQFFCLLFIYDCSSYASGNSISGSRPEVYPITDTLPLVLSENHPDLMSSKLKWDASKLFALHQLPASKEGWIVYRQNLIKEIITNAGITFNHDLPLNLKETASIQLKGYSVKNIYFQTLPGVYATANLYIPDGGGKFPAVLVMMGHSFSGRLDDKYQALGHTLAINGYVALCIDPWGAGERTTIHAQFEDHGDENNLGSSLMNIGEPLIGIEISENMRGIDLLCSLPNVDTLKIGATGSSGGGNQTMWLAAMDQRVKAAVPVVSAGTFESYIMGTPCICEVLPGGLNLTEEAEILSLVAPRAIKMCNHQKDNNQAFTPFEMIRSYQNAKPIFDLLGVGKNIGYEIFDLKHGYFPEDREAMLGWFDLHLRQKGDGSSKKEVSFVLLPAEKLMVFTKGERSKDVTTTAAFCKFKGDYLRAKYLKSDFFDAEKKRDELRQILGINSTASIKSIHQFPDLNGWSRIAIESKDNKLIPLLIHPPSHKSGEFVILCSSEGKGKISNEIIDRLIISGKGVVLVDLSGTGEVVSKPNSADKNGNLLTLSRSLLWFGKTIIGDWVTDLDLVTKYIFTQYGTDKLTIDGNKEAGIAVLCYSALGGKCENTTLRNSPISYLFDNRENIDFFGLGINIPGFLNWGDISLAAAISGKNITWIDPVTMSGRKLCGNELEDYRREFKKIRTVCSKSGITIFTETNR